MSANTFFCDLCDAIFVTEQTEKLCERCTSVVHPLPKVGTLVRYRNIAGTVVTGTVISYNGRRVCVKPIGGVGGYSLIDTWTEVTV